MRTTPSSATKEMNKVMGRLRRGSSFKAEDLEGVGKGGKSGPIPVPSPWASQLRTRDCSPSLEEDSPEGSSFTLSRSAERGLAEISREFVLGTSTCPFCGFVPQTFHRCGTPGTEQGEKSSGGTPCSKLS